MYGTPLWHLGQHSHEEAIICILAVVVDGTKEAIIIELGQSPAGTAARAAIRAQTGILHNGCAQLAGVVARDEIRAAAGQRARGGVRLDDGRHLPRTGTPNLLRLGQPLRGRLRVAIRRRRVLRHGFSGSLHACSLIEGDMYVALWMGVVAGACSQPRDVMREELVRHARPSAPPAARTIQVPTQISVPVDLLN